jgi:hypothetical protein
MEKGWLKPILEQASADRDTWPAWQRGYEVQAGQTQLTEPDGHDEKASEDREVAA